MTKTSKDIQMVQYLSHRLLPLATGIGLLLTLLGPLTYWVIEHRSLQYMTNLYAGELAERFRDFALDNPSLWKYQAYKFSSLVNEFHPAIDVLGFNILDEKGAPISGYRYNKDWEKHGKEPSFAEDLKVTIGTAPIIFNNLRVGSVEVLVTDARLQRACAILFCISALVGTALAFLVYRFPVRVTRKMEEKIKGLLSAVQQSEERYRSLVEMSLVGVYIIIDGRFRYVNPKFSDIFGWRSEELIEKKGPADLILPDDWPTVQQNLRKVISGDISSVNNEFRGVTKDNRVIFLEVYGSRTTYQGQTAVIGTLLDISERKRVEEEVRILNEELEQRVNIKTGELLDAREELVRKEKLAILGQLSGSVGHELRNPLGVMSNAVYFLKMVLTDADEITKEYLDIIMHEIDSSQQIITDLLDFARTRKPQTKTVPAHELLEGILGKCVIPDTVNLQTEIPDTLPLLRIDPLQMEQVFQNLITNGVQAMPKGGALSVRAREVRGTRNEEQGDKEINLGPRTPIHDPGFIEISVTDTGEGISPENMKRLFQPLFTTKAKGIGLGLVVCRNLVEANGGKIEVKSELGKGTTFGVLIPTGEKD